MLCCDLSKPLGIGLYLKKDRTHHLQLSLRHNRRTSQMARTTFKILIIQSASQNTMMTNKGASSALPMGVPFMLLCGWIITGFITETVTAFLPLVPSSFKYNTARRSLTSVNMAPTKEDLLGARDAVDKLLREKACGKITVS
jgi:hypothetical protein